MKPCPHGQSRRHEVWHRPPHTPTMLEMARLCVDCVQREQRAGVRLLRADGVTPFVLPDVPKQEPAPAGKEETVPRIRPVEIVCAKCGKASKLKAKGMCTRCYDVDRRAHLKSAKAERGAGRSKEATAPAPAPTPAPVPAQVILDDSGGPMVKAPVAVDGGEVEQLRAELADAQARLEAWDLWHGLTTRGQSSEVLLRNLLHIAAGGAVGA